MQERQRGRFAGACSPDQRHGVPIFVLEDPAGAALAESEAEARDVIVPLDVVRLAGGQFESTSRIDCDFHVPSPENWEEHGKIETLSQFGNARPIDRRYSLIYCDLQGLFGRPMPRLCMNFRSVSVSKTGGWGFESLHSCQ